jgi:hypothetical protein
MNKQAGIVVFLFALLASLGAIAQETKVSARMDAAKIVVGDQARLFIDVAHNPASGTLEWAAIPDTFNSLEVVERGKIDTVKQGATITYRQRLLITGFDSGMFKVPSFMFAVIPPTGEAYGIASDSFQLLVETVPVDTTKAFKPIKDVMDVKGSWRDYIWLIIGAAVFIALLVFIVAYFVKNKKVAIPKPAGPVETLQERTLRLLAELDTKQLWQKKQVKEYYVQLTDIVRNYIEERFHTPALELTTDELLYKVQHHRELQPYHGLLSGILYTADLAKFAKAEPLPQEHMAAMDNAKKLVESSKPVIINTTDTAPAQTPGDKKI